MGAPKRYENGQKRQFGDYVPRLDMTDLTHGQLYEGSTKRNGGTKTASDYIASVMYEYRGLEWGLTFFLAIKKPLRICPWLNCLHLWSIILFYQPIFERGNSRFFPLPKWRVFSSSCTYRFCNLSYTQRETRPHRRIKGEEEFAGNCNVTKWWCAWNWQKGKLMSWELEKRIFGIPIHIVGKLSVFNELEYQEWLIRQRATLNSEERVGISSSTLEIESLTFFVHLPRGQSGIFILHMQLNMIMQKRSSLDIRVHSEKLGFERFFSAFYYSLQIIHLVILHCVVWFSLLALFSFGHPPSFGMRRALYGQRWDVTQPLISGSWSIKHGQETWCTRQATKRSENWLPLGRY